MGETYEKALDQLADSRPRVAEFLRRSHENRSTWLNRSLDGARLRGLEELLNHLDALVRVLSNDASATTFARLFTRVIYDVEVAVEATLAGDLPVAFDAMRDVMETEFIIRDIALDPSQRTLWERRDPDVIRRRFRPVLVRQRLKDAGVPGFGENAESVDYKGHSMALHVTPFELGLMDRRRTAADQPILADAGWWEVFEHVGRRILSCEYVIRDLLTELDWRDVPEPDDLARVADAWARTRQMQGIFLALLTGGPDGLREWIEAEGDNPLAELWLDSEDPRAQD